MVTRSETVNFFHKDQIWKDYVQGEMRHQKAPIWPDTWKFLSSNYKDFLSPTKEQLLEGEPKNEELIPIQPSFGKIIADLQQNLQPKPSNYPSTTSAEIGWKVRNVKKIDKYTRNNYGRKNITKVFNWPREGMD